MIHELKFSSDTVFSCKSKMFNVLQKMAVLNGRDVQKNTNNGWTICPAEWSPRINYFEFFLSKYKKGMDHQTTHLLICRLKSVKYDLDTVCPRKNANPFQNLIFWFLACFRWKRGEICSLWTLFGILLLETCMKERNITQQKIG
jgi:hypothetical protein